MLKRSYLPMMVLAVVLVLAGCQAGEEVADTGEGEMDARAGEAAPVPFSSGPNEPPRVRGPLSPPPDEVPEAVTQKENIKLVLPKE